MANNKHSGRKAEQREILQCDLNGNPINIFKSILEASKATKLQFDKIYKCANRILEEVNATDGKGGHYKSYRESHQVGGYVWKYVDELPDFEMRDI